MELESVTPLDLLPGARTGQQPPSHRDVRQALRMMLILALVAFPAAWFWREVVIGLLYFLGYVYLFLIFPVTAFAILGAIVFAVGWYLPLWPGLMRRAAWQRASSVLAAAVVLHTVWFLFGWVTFHPLCSIKLGMGTTDTGNRALIGKLDPAYADRFQRALAGAWGDAAAQSVLRARWSVDARGNAYLQRHAAKLVGRGCGASRGSECH